MYKLLINGIEFSLPQSCAITYTRTQDGKAALIFGGTDGKLPFERPIAESYQIKLMKGSEVIVDKNFKSGVDMINLSNGMSNAAVHFSE